MWGAPDQEDKWTGPQSRSQGSRRGRRGLWGVLRGKGSEERRKKKSNGSTGRETKEEEQYLEKQQAELVQLITQTCFQALLSCPLLGFHFQLGFPLASLLHPPASLHLLSTSPGGRCGSRGVRGLGSAPQGVRRRGRKQSPKQNRTWRSSPPSGSFPLHQHKYKTAAERNARME